MFGWSYLGSLAPPTKLVQPMSLRTLLLPAVVLSAAVAGCGDQSPVVVTEQSADGRVSQGRGAVAAVAVSDQYTAGRLSGIVDTYFDQNLALNPIFATFVGVHRYDDRLGLSISPDHRARQLALEQRFLDALLELDQGGLAGQDLLTYEIFERGRRDAIAGLQFPSHLIPVNQFFSTPNFFATLAAGTSAHPFNTVEDYDNMLSRMDDFDKWVDQAIVNMRAGVAAGVVQPRVIMEKVLPQLAAQTGDDPEETIFYGAVSRMPESFSEPDRQRLQRAYREKIAAKVVPSYQRLHDFIRDEYLAATTDGVGLSRLPDGEDWYAHLVRLQTTTSLTPDEIHEIGLAEVERITAGMEAIRAEVGFDGDLAAFFEHLRTDPRFYYDEPEQLLESYRALKSTVAQAAPELFSLIPEADFEVRAVEPFREQSASGAFYVRAAPDGSRPGVFYVNTYNIKSRPKYAVEALYLHEAVPGHHFQISLQQELDDLPAVRRFGAFTAYVEGWGLYAETLGDELGLYTDPYQRFGFLDAQMVRAIRLVADTGMHAKGWTREQALQFMMDHSSISETRAVSEIERYIAIPGQALAYKIGQLRISELRARAERALGAAFDVSAFHAQALADGALPLDVLEAKIDRWIESQG